MAVITYPGTGTFPASTDFPGAAEAGPTNAAPRVPTNPSVPSVGGK